MPSPGPDGQPWSFRAVAPITQQITVDPAEVVAAAERSGRFPPWRRAHWMAEVSAGGTRGGTAIITMMQLMPAPPEVRAAWVRASGGQDGDNAVYAALYPAPQEAAQGRPGPEPDRLAQGDLRLGWLRLNASTGPGAPGDDGDPADPEGGDHAVIDHERITVKSHDHAHSSYLGGTHRHPHSHLDSASHAPDGVLHAHNPVASGIAARVRATAAPSLSDDEVYARLYGGG